ncbi:MAG TPA: response regulator transcription factor [Lichenihabitans sp.]|jgi:DNA-binding NarL/FixJ family response regulator|nr:response regulator transcription factor [Lichenihabitans sp.]
MNFQASPTPSISNISGSNDGQKAKPVFSIIDAQCLSGESLAFSLQWHDVSARYEHFTSINSWKSGSEVNSSLLILNIDGSHGSAEINFDASVAALKESEPSPPFVVLSDIEDAPFVVQCLEKGASGYIPTSMSLAVASQVLHLVLAGGVFIPSTALVNLADRPPAYSEAPLPLQTLLSSKETLVARELRKGTPNKIIAYHLNMCESTVKVHVRNIMRKMCAKNRTEVAYLSNQMFGTIDKVGLSPVAAARDRAASLGAGQSVGRHIGFMPGGR